MDSDERLAKVESAVAALHSEVAEVKGGIRALAEGQGRMAVDLAIVKTEVTNHVAELRRDVAEIKGTTSNRSSEMWRQGFYFVAGIIVAIGLAFLNHLL